MTERPILFSGTMVRAILNGTKTQTRRIVKGRKQPWDGKDCLQECKTVERDGTGHGFVFWKNGLGGAEFTKQQYPTVGWQCPYGKPGDLIWVKETHRFPTWDTIEYRADGTKHHVQDNAGILRENDIGSKWRPSLFMWRWASRITLDVVSVRVERLQDISEADAKAEGCEPMCLTCGENCLPLGCGMCQVRYKASYANLWESINGPGSWDANPWVWVVEFHKLDQP